MGKFVEKVKTGAKKTWTWIKAHPGETCLMVGSALISGTIGKNLGTRSGYKKGYSIAQKERDERSRLYYCDMFDLDPDPAKDDWVAYTGKIHCASLQEIVDGIKENPNIPDDATFSGKLVLNGSEHPVEK